MTHACQTGDAIEPFEAADGTPLCRVRVNGEERVFVDRCPHRGHPISRGELSGGVIRCAMHGWEFSAETGRLVSPAGPFGLEPWEE